MDVGYDSLVKLAVIVGSVASVVLYAKALTMARAGRLVVYCGWGDFLKSAAWIVSVPVGLIWGRECGDDWVLRNAGWVLVALGVCSSAMMVYGAFRFNHGLLCLLSLFARVAVILLMAFAIVKLCEQIENYRRHKHGVYRGILIPLALFAAVFNWLVRPMIGSRSEL